MQRFDLTTALQATDGDVELLREVIMAFLDEYPILLEQIAKAIASADYATIQRASHTIKGTLRLFGDVPAREIAQQLEELGKNKTIENSSETLQSLQVSLQAMRPGLLYFVQNQNTG